MAERINTESCSGTGFCDVLGESEWSLLNLLHGAGAVDVCEEDGARVGRSKRGEGWHAGVDDGSDLSPDKTVFWSSEL